MTSSWWGMHHSELRGKLHQIRYPNQKKCPVVTVILNCNQLVMCQDLFRALVTWRCCHGRGWCELCCGRGCGFCIGPIRRYREAFSTGRWMPTLQVSNYMNHEAILQVIFLGHKRNVLF